MSDEATDDTAAENGSGNGASAEAEAAPPSRKLRTWSSFGDIRRKPTEYEIVSHDLNYTTRADRHAPLESNPTSPMNMWLSTYRDRSPLQVDDWHAYRDPDRLTYRAYTTGQAEAEHTAATLLDEYSEAGHDAGLSTDWLAALGALFCPLRFPYHGIQQIQAYIGLVSPTSYLTNAASFAAADCFRVVNLAAYRTTELSQTHPDAGFGTDEREHWQGGAAWQPLRRAIETAMIAYDFGEALTATNLVIRPAVESVLFESLGEVARANEDDLTWLLLKSLGDDGERAGRWSAEVARFGVAANADNVAVFAKWVSRWRPRAVDAAAALAEAVAAVPGSPLSADDIAAAAEAAMDALLEASQAPVAA